jgi:hypothetical protein
MHPQPASPAAGAAATLGALRDAYGRATAVGDEAELDVTVAQGGVKVRAADGELLEILGRAIEHLAVDGWECPELTIHVWDSADGPSTTPPLPAADPDGPRGAVVYSELDEFQLAYQPGLGQLHAYDARSRSAWFWCRDRHNLPFWEPSAPFRQILHWWFAPRGVMLLHGAAVGRADGGILLVGRGGSGKSTCALASLASDLLYAGDDYVAVSLEPEPLVHSVYASGKLVPGHSKLLPHLPTASFAGDEAADEKSIFFVSAAFPERMCRSFPLRAVVAPRVTPGRPSFHEATSAEALKALAPSTLLQLYPARPAALAKMADLLRRVPAYTFETGDVIEAIPGAIARLLEELEK